MTDSTTAVAGPAKTGKKRDRTRARLLEVAFRAFWRGGYNGTRLEMIIEESEFTKGAFYYYFPSKRELIDAVLDEVIGGMLHARWIEPLAEVDDPLTALQDIFRLHMGSCDDLGLCCGCPLNNL